jgi:hypothetical protein
VDELPVDELPVLEPVLEPVLLPVVPEPEEDLSRVRFWSGVGGRLRVYPTPFTAWPRTWGSAGTGLVTTMTTGRCPGYQPS